MFERKAGGCPGTWAAAGPGTAAEAGPDAAAGAGEGAVAGAGAGAGVTVAGAWAGDPGCAGTGAVCAPSTVAARATETEMPRRSDRDVTSGPLLGSCRRAAHLDVLCGRGDLDLVGRDRRLRAGVNHLVLRAQIACDLVQVLSQAAGRNHCVERAAAFARSGGQQKRAFANGRVGVAVFEPA